MEDKEILKQFKEISNNLMSRCSPDSDIYPLVTALISLFNLVINITQEPSFIYFQFLNLELCNSNSEDLHLFRG